MLVPKLFTTLKDYDRNKFFADLNAGVIVGIVALPLAIAFAIASGVSPEKGLITAIVGGFLISALGGSRVQIGGPTGAFIVIVYGIVQQYGIEGLTIATLIAGLMLIGLGLARLGNVIKFIPFPVIVGFTSGIAVIIFSSQVNDLFGLNILNLPGDFIDKWKMYGETFSAVNYYSLGLALLTIFIIIVWQRFVRKIPGSLMAIIVVTAIVYFLKLPVETIGSRFGDMPSHLPRPGNPEINFATVQQLIKPAFTIAILGAIESLLSAVVADGMIGGRHRSNMELVGQGVANIACGFFGGIPATGAIARTVTNIKNGAKTPVAGMIHAVVLLLILLFFGSWAKLIPMSCLAGILVVIAYNMSEWRSFANIVKSSKSEAFVLIITFLLTVLVDLTVAIEIGLVLALLMFMRQMAESSNIKAITNEDDKDSLLRRGIKIPDEVEVFEIDGPLFFGLAQKFEEVVRETSAPPKVRIINLQEVPYLDTTGLHAIEKMHRHCKNKKIRFMLSGLHDQPLELLYESGLMDKIGKVNFKDKLEEALIVADALVHKQHEKIKNLPADA